MKNITFIFHIILSLLFFYGPTFAAIDPAIKWRILTTPHFEIIFNAKQQPLALKYAHYAEKAHDMLVPTFKEFPKRTVVWINDSTDLSNGSATPFPYPTITVFPVIPGPLETIGDYENWGQDLMTHEYTHILTFEPAHGVMRPIRWLLGSIFSPNALLPRWYLEGIAVEAETRWSRSGRLRSPYQDAILRGMVQDRTLRQETIDRINETSIPSWPQGARPYLFGSLIWNEIAQSAEDAQPLYDLTQSYSRRLPYFINGPAEDLSGRSYRQILSDVYGQLETAFSQELPKFESTRPYQSERLASPGYKSHSPSISPDGKKLAFVGNRHDEAAVVYLRQRSSVENPFDVAQSEIIKTGRSIQKLDWFPDSQRLVFDLTDKDGDYYFYSDLYIYNSSTKKIDALTKGERAREPTVSPDGETIVYVQLSDGKTQLKAYHMEAQTSEVLWQPKKGYRISRPEYIDTEKIVLSLKDQRGNERLFLLNTGPKGASPAAKPHPILRDFAGTRFPKSTGQGLLFVSPQSGLNNLYLAKPPYQTAIALTNSRTGIVNADYDPYRKEYYLSEFRGEGLFLHRWQAKDLDKPIAQVSPLISYDETTKPSQALAIKKPSFKATVKDYSPWPYMLPRYWLPFIYPLEDGALITASTSASDPINRHSYALTAGFNSVLQKPLASAQYNYRWGIWTWSLAASDEYYSTLSPSSYLHESGVTTSLTRPLSFFGDDWQTRSYWTYRTLSNGTEQVDRHGPGLEIIYSDVSRKGHQISPEKGWQWVLGGVYYFTSPAPDNYYRLHSSFATYWSKWLPARNVLHLNINAAHANSRNTFVGTITRGFNYQTSLQQSSFLVRGYPTGAFVGQDIVSATLEYRLPLRDVYRGPGTAPYFTRRLHAALFSDHVTGDGVYQNRQADGASPMAFGDVFSSVGAEILLETTLFYHFPATFNLGFYYGLNEQAYGGQWVPFLGIAL